MLNRFPTRVISRRTFALSSGASLAVLATRDVLGAQSATPVASDTAAASNGVTAEVLLTGLADPRFVVVDGSDVYFSESGTGGDEPVILPPGEGTPEAADPVSFTGSTGKVSKLSADGTVTEVASGLRSYTFGAAGEIVGPAGIALDGNGSLYVSVGAPGPYIADLPRHGDEGVVIKVDLESGEQEIIADLLQWELDNNPDPATIDSNLYGMAYSDGVLYVADSGGNALLSVNTETREVATFAVTGGLEAEFLPESGNPLRGGAREIDSVPGGVEIGPDGRIYISYITGGPFPPGIAPIDAFSVDGTKETAATGLTMTGDIAFASDGMLYASIVSTDLINQGPGQVVRVEANGGLTVIIDGLVMTAGIAFDADDNLYVVNKSSIVPGGGELVKYTGVTKVPAQVDSATPVVSTPVPADVVAPAEPYKIAMVDTAFEPNTLTIPANVDVVLHFENQGYLAHDFVLENPKTVSDVLGHGKTTQLTLNLGPGEYTFYCSQVGHRAIGMEGTLTVV